MLGGRRKRCSSAPRAVLSANGLGRAVEGKARNAAASGPTAPRLTQGGAVTVGVEIVGAWASPVRSASALRGQGKEVRHDEGGEDGAGGGPGRPAQCPYAAARPRTDAS